MIALGSSVFPRILQKQTSTAAVFQGGLPQKEIAPHVGLSLFIDQSFYQLDSIRIFVGKSPPEPVCQPPMVVLVNIVCRNAAVKIFFVLFEGAWPFDAITRMLLLLCC